jgi:hypothetical protein
MSRIDRIRRSLTVRRTSKSEADGAQAARPAAANLPVVVGSPERVTPAPAVGLGGDAEFNAHVLGQDGQRRGLRAGPTLLDAARRAYNRTE